MLTEIPIAERDPAGGRYRVVDWTERINPSLGP